MNRDGVTRREFVTSATGAAVGALVAVIAAGVAAALARRSWPLWLLAFLLLVVAIWGAYLFRTPVTAR